MTLMIQTKSCEIPMKRVWDCAMKHDKYKKGCLAATDIHKGIRRAMTMLGSSKLFAEEGPRYKKLFTDCTNERSPRCIIPSVASYLPKCKRSCEWRKEWIKTLC